jgi:hypothetical protein
MQQIPVYVRKAADRDSDRTLSIPRFGIENIPPRAWLEQWYAFDGNQLIRQVSVQGLPGVQKSLTEFLAPYGYEPTFI